MNYTQYINCKEHLDEVKNFLSQFFKEKKGRYNHSKWITFTIPKTKMNVNLMVADDLPITKSITFERVCDSMKELERFATKHNRKIESFKATATGKPYMFYYIEIWGPKKICKIDMSYSKNIKVS